MSREYCCQPTTQPGVKHCLDIKCQDLGKQEWPPGSGRFRKVCKLAGDRIPGNIVCPRETTGL